MTSKLSKMSHGVTMTRLGGGTEYLRGSIVKQIADVMPPTKALSCDTQLAATLRRTRFHAQRSKSSRSRMCAVGVATAPG